MPDRRVRAARPCCPAALRAACLPPLQRADFCFLTASPVRKFVSWLHPGAEICFLKSEICFLAAKQVISPQNSPNPPILQPKF